MSLPAWEMSPAIQRDFRHKQKHTGKRDTKQVRRLVEQAHTSLAPSFLIIQIVPETFSSKTHLFSPPKKLAKQGLFWLTKSHKSLNILFYWTGFTADKTTRLVRQRLHSCPHNFLQRSHLHAILWWLLGQNTSRLHIQALLEKGKQLFKAFPTHNKGNIFISVKHMERIFLASKGSLRKTMHATVTKRKDFLSCKLKDPHIPMREVDFLPSSHHKH